MAPEERIIYLLASTFFSSLPSQNSTSLAVLSTKLIFFTCALVIIFKLFLSLIGFKYPTDVLHLKPSF